ncbi:MAG TPA: hypothetical protein VGP07_07280 [Polyangia bacterium]|jgi:hypothetical protein
MTATGGKKVLPWITPVVRAEPDKKIIGFWHIGAVGDWDRIVAEQYGTLKQSGLHDASAKIVVGFVGGKGREHELERSIPTLRDGKFELFVTERIEDYEFPTLSRVWGEARAGSPPFLCYYLHTKGASYVGAPEHGAVNAWRHYMEYFNLERWRDCVTVLRDHETCGVELQTENSHYSGNFWWATSAYVKRLPDARQYWAQHRDDRLAAEFYLCLGAPKAHCFNDFVENLYDYAVPPERYRR